MGRGRLLATVAAAAAAVVSSATGAAVPRVSLSASPPQLLLADGGAGAVEVRTLGTAKVDVAASMVEYAVSADGTVVVDPARAPTRSARKWLSVSPKSLTLAAGASATVRVSADGARSVPAGDYHALVLLATKGSTTGGVGVSARLGVGVLVRVQGKISRRLAIVGVGVRKRALHVRLANRGNVNERLLRGQVSVRLARGGRTLARLIAPARTLLPHTRGYVTVRVPRSLKGRVVAIVHVRPTSARQAGMNAPAAAPVQRSFRLVLPAKSG